MHTLLSFIHSFIHSQKALIQWRAYPAIKTFNSRLFVLQVTIILGLLGSEISRIIRPTETVQYVVTVHTDIITKKKNSGT